MKGHRKNGGRINLKQLSRICEAEGLVLAKRVRKGELTRSQLEAAFEEHGDVEPAIALRWLDKWGIE